VGCSSHPAVDLYEYALRHWICGRHFLFKKVLSAMTLGHEPVEAYRRTINQEELQSCLPVAL
jgi:hypothetical protein